MLTFPFKSVLKLDFPFGLRTIHLEHGNAHHEDNDTTGEILSKSIKYATLLEELYYAIRLNTPSQRSSLLDQRSAACVNQTAIKAAPTASAITKPDIAPRNIWRVVKVTEGVSYVDKLLTCHRSFLINRLTRTFSSSWIEVVGVDPFSLMGSSIFSSEGVKGLSTAGGAGAESLLTICSTRPRRTETMIAASRVSRKTIKKMGMLNRLRAMGYGDGNELPPV